MRGNQTTSLSVGPCLPLVRDKFSCPLLQTSSYMVCRIPGIVWSLPIVLLLKCWDYKRTLFCLALHGFWGFKLLCSGLWSKYFTWWAISPAKLTLIATILATHKCANDGLIHISSLDLSQECIFILLHFFTIGIINCSFAQEGFSVQLEWYWIHHLNQLSLKHFLPWPAKCWNYRCATTPGNNLASIFSSYHIFAFGIVLWRSQNGNLFPPLLKVREFQLPQSCYLSTQTKGQRVRTYFYSFKVTVCFYLKPRCHLDLGQRVLPFQGYCLQLWLLSRPCVAGTEK